MHTMELENTKFDGICDKWSWSPEENTDYTITDDGIQISAYNGKKAIIDASNVHTRDGDTIELLFSIKEASGSLSFGFAGGTEGASVMLDFTKNSFTFQTSDANIPQPVECGSFSVRLDEINTLTITKERKGKSLIYSTQISVHLNGERILNLKKLDMLPEMGVVISVKEACIKIHRFIHRGMPYKYPEYLHLGAWQVLNAYNIEENLQSIMRGISAAAEAGVQFLMTPESSLSGLLNGNRYNIYEMAKPCHEAEKKLIQFIRETKNAPYVVAGVPELMSAPNGHKAWYNLSRVYDPDGNTVISCRKIHSCESGFAHGLRLNEFEIYNVPVCMHICHDARYPDTWTLPVMFGARIVLHPSNGGNINGTISHFESSIKGSTANHHCVHMHSSAGGGSFIAAPKGRSAEIIASSSCVNRNNSSFPMVGKPQEELVHGTVRTHNAFGYWPVRSLKSSAGIEKAYIALYKEYGGKRTPGEALI